MIAKYLQSDGPCPSHTKSCGFWGAMELSQFKDTQYVNNTFDVAVLYTAKFLETAEECVTVQYSAEKSVMS